MITQCDDGDDVQDVTPEQAYAWQQSGEGVIVDVRTEAERTWVGVVPGAIGLPWVHWPGMQPNAEFDATMRAIELGALQCYNVLEGFEGALDDNQQRGKNGGWRFRGLPWVQR